MYSLEYDVVVIGAGRIGYIAALDLVNSSFDVLVVDVADERLKKFEELNVKTMVLDVLKADSLKSMFKGVKVVSTALPGPIAYNAVMRLLKLGFNVVDVSYYPEDVWSLEGYAVESKVVYVPDAGLAPGLSNVLIGRSKVELERLYRAYIYVGGVSHEPDDLLGLALTWSPIDLIEEYVRPARIIEGGKVKQVDPLELTGSIEIPKVGVMEYFVSDGLRTMLKTMRDVGEMRECTLRYPGHIEKMRFLKKLKLLDKYSLKFDGVEVDVRKFLARILEVAISNKFQDKVILYTYCEGVKGTSKYLLIKNYDAKSRTSAMSLTTGYMLSTTSKMVADELIEYHGIFPPENIGLDSKLYAHLVKELKDKGIVIERV